MLLQKNHTKINAETIDG